LTWWTDYQARRGGSRKDLYVNNMKNLVKNKFEYSTSYELVTINGISRDVRIVEESSNGTIVKNPNKKRLLCYPNETIVVGDIIVWNSENWICVNNDISSSISDIGIIEKCNNTLSFYSPTDSTLHQIPCIIGKASISQDENKFLSLPADENLVTCANTVDSLKITENTRFILSGDAFKVIGIDKISNLGLLSIRIKDDQVTEDDNVSLGIANYYSNQHIYTIDIQNSDATLNASDTLTLDVVCTDNSVIVTSPTITYSSSDITIATVSTSGVVTCIAEGIAVITATFNSVSDTLNLTVQSATIPDNYTVSITGASTVKLNSNITLTSTIYNNGVEDGSKSVVWTFSNQDGSSNVYCTLVSSTGSSITLKVTSNSSYINKYVVVRGSKSDDALIYYDFVIQIKSLF